MSVFIVPLFPTLLAVKVVNPVAFMFFPVLFVMLAYEVIPDRELKSSVPLFVIVPQAA